MLALFAFRSFQDLVEAMVFVRSFLSATTAAVSLLFTSASAQLSNTSLTSHVDVLPLDFSFNPVKAAYWTNLPHHRRTPFAVGLQRQSFSSLANAYTQLSPDHKTAYIAYLDFSETDVHVQQVNPADFTAEGSAVTITGGKEAGGLVAQNNGFALLTNIVSRPSPCWFVWASNSRITGRKRHRRSP